MELRNKSEARVVLHGSGSLEQDRGCTWAGRRRMLTVLQDCLGVGLSFSPTPLGLGPSWAGLGLVWPWGVSLTGV